MRESAGALRESARGEAEAGQSCGRASPRRGPASGRLPVPVLIPASDRLPAPSSLPVPDGRQLRRVSVPSGEAASPECHRFRVRMSAVPPTPSSASAVPSASRVLVPVCGRVETGSGAADSGAAGSGAGA